MSKKLESVSVLHYAKLLSTLNTPESDERLKELQKAASAIFEFDSDGKIAKVRRGKYLVPQFNKFYVIFNLRKVGSFMAALLEYVIGELEKPIDYDKIDKRIVTEDEKADATLEYKEHPIVKEVVEIAEKEKKVMTSRKKPATSRKTTTTKKTTTTRKPRTTKK